MTTNQALQKLYKKIVGSDSKKNSVAKNIQALAENWPAAEGLPAVTASDNGKVLSVVEGVWNKSASQIELPAYTSADANKVLAVKSDGTLEWKTLG